MTDTLHNGTPITLLGQPFDVTRHNNGVTTVTVTCWASWVSMFNGVTYLTVRQVYRDTKGNWQAGQHGASLPIEQAAHMLTAAYGLIPVEYLPARQAAAAKTGARKRNGNAGVTA